VVLYLIYIVRIGGDFMTGRFFAAPLLVSVVLLARFSMPSKGVGLWAPFAAVLLLSLTSPRSPLLASGSYGIDSRSHGSIRGIADERGFYYQSTGLLCNARGRSMPDHWWISQGRQLKESGRLLTHDATIGFRGYAAGPTVHIVDELALADPLLSRLLAAEPDDWRIGHVRRTLPLGYLTTCRTGTNSIRDSGLAEYYEHLHTIIAGPIWSWRRLQDVVRMNLGRFDDLLHRYAPLYDMLVPYADVCTPKRRGTVWNRAGNVVLSDRGVMIEMDSVVSCSAVELSVDHNDSYELVYWLGMKQVGTTNIGVNLISERGLRVDTLTVETDQGMNRFDAVQIRPAGGDDRYSLGHFRLLNVSDKGLGS
jgi:arabinofuranosyltransferase